MEYQVSKVSNLYENTKQWEDKRISFGNLPLGYDQILFDSEYSYTEE